MKRLLKKVPPDVPLTIATIVSLTFTGFILYWGTR
jgi:hypothetical protein